MLQYFYRQARRAVALQLRSFSLRTAGHVYLVVDGVVHGDGIIEAVEGPTDVVLIDVPLNLGIVLIVRLVTHPQRTLHTRTRHYLAISTLKKVKR